MLSINRVILIGYLGDDPEVRQTAGGQSVCRLRLATSRRFADGSGTAQEEVTWHRVTVWGRQGDNCATYLRKGRPVYVEGRIRKSSYEDQAGIRRTSTEVVAQTVQFLPEGRGRNGQPVDEPPGYEGSAALSDAA